MEDCSAVVERYPSEEPLDTWLEPDGVSDVEPVAVPEVLEVEPLLYEDKMPGIVVDVVSHAVSV